jgi:hypothetical protein
MYHEESEDSRRKEKFNTFLAKSITVIMKNMVEFSLGTVKKFIN